MKINDYRQYNSGYGCKEVRDLLMLYVLDRGDLSLDERNHIGSHLEKCASCREEYKQTKLVNDVLIANRDFFIREKVFRESRPDTDSEPLSDVKVDFLQFQCKLERVLARRKRAERGARWERLRPALKVASTAAACLIVGLGLFWAVIQYNRTSDESQVVASIKPQNSVKIELISGSHVETLPVDEPILALNEPQTLQINGNRQMVLNTGTQLSIEPYNLGCMVKLDKGEIYTEVEHDGKPFIVETAHGRAVITGTTFNIKADENRMELAVVEGAVRLESPQGTVNVRGGYRSLVALGNKPTEPVASGRTGEFKWAKIQDVDRLAPASMPEANLTEVPDWTAGSTLTWDLENLDYHDWIEQHREWFEREFPWAKRLQTQLAQEGVAVDTIDLLIQSGQLWQFAWPQHSSRQLVTEPADVRRFAASQYGIDSESGEISLLSTQPEQLLGLRAFEEWRSAFKRDQKAGGVVLESIHAATWLARTRTLMWLAVREEAIPVWDRQQVLSLLSWQVKLGADSVEALLRLLADQKEPACASPQCEEIEKGIIESISAMAEIEQELEGYEIHGK